MPCTIEPYCSQVTGTRRAVWVHSELQVDKFCQKSRIFIEFRALRWWDTRVFSTHRRGGKCYVHDGINACFRWIGWNAHFHAIYRATVVDGHVWDSISQTNLHYSSCYFYVNLYLDCVYIGCRWFSLCLEIWLVHWIVSVCTDWTKNWAMCECIWKQRALHVLFDLCI